MTQKLSEKRDVYSFGIALLELVMPCLSMGGYEYIVRLVRNALETGGVEYL